MSFLAFRPVAAACALATALAAPALQAAPVLATRDLGPATAPVTVSVVLRHAHGAELARLIDAQHTPGDPQFRHFLTPAQFHARFDPLPATSERARAYFERAGLQVAQDGAFVQVTGSPAALRRAFGTALRRYELPAAGGRPARRFHAPTSVPRIADIALAGEVVGIVGLDDAPRFASNLRHAPAAARHAAPAVRAQDAGSGHAPGYWTVTDVAAHYDVQPLWDAGLHGEGRTVGIVTLAAFTPSDVFRYWDENGLVTDPGRLTVVDVGGGAGPVSDYAGSGETTLDVAQAGGLAPGARIVVYEAPNTMATYLQAFYRAVDQNVADTISTSWGAFEGIDALVKVQRSDKTNASYLKAFSQVFMQAAAQGQTLFAASGDEGAYDANRAYPQPYFEPVLSVDAPASSPWITAAGGTTLAGTQRYIVGGKPFEVAIDSEQAWGWQYMDGLCAAIGFDPLACGTWGVGGGGGVSSWAPVPGYQKHLGGMAASPTGQVLREVDVDPAIDWVDLPGGFAGRNLPDISLNADPNTGYALGYTSSSSGYGVTAFEGGTSFVAPQLNGIAALLAQKVGGRIGFLNYPLYGLARQGGAWDGASAPFHDVTAGDNWSWTAGPGYDRATGLGTLDVAHFADALVGLAAR